ncbi:MAG: aldose 1-epimerase family protein [Gammaproteobacteria bacterium]
MPDQPNSWVTVRSTELSAGIDPLGAQLSALRDSAGRGLLWHGDPAVWAGRAPLLFPIVGTLAGGRYRLGDQSFALGRHGFARGKPFEIVASTPSAAVFRLGTDEATLAVYPFQFELEVAFTVAGPTLSIVATARNLGSEKMPASLGFHPGFLWPLPFGQARSNHFIQFEADEPAPVRRIDSAGLMTDERHPTPIVNRRLALTDELFRNDVLILDQVQSRAVVYGAEGGPQLEIRFPDSTCLGLWTKPGAPFVCIEPWQGVTDPAGFAGDIREKPGIFEVAPGATHSITMAITLRGAQRAGAG